MKHYLLFALLLISFSVLAQRFDTYNEAIDSVFPTRLTGESYFEKKGYKGEQYFNKQWMPGDIILSTGETVTNEKLKYNGLLDELIWVNGFINQQFKLDKSLISEFRLKNEQGQYNYFRHITVPKPITNQPVDIFAELAVEGELSLFVQRKISVTNVDEIAIDGVHYNQETIKATPVYYLKMLLGNYLLLDKIKLTSFIQLFPTQKKQITQIIKSNNLKFKTEKDLIKLIDILNTHEF